MLEQINRYIVLSICVIIIKESWGDVVLHVGGADQQDLEQHGLSNLVGRDRSFIMAYWAIMLSLECMINWEPFGQARLLLSEYLRHHHKGVKRLPVLELLPAQLSKPDCWDVL